MSVIHQILDGECNRAEFMAIVTAPLDCGACSACCKGLDVFMRPGDDASIFDLTRKYPDESTGEPNLKLPQQPNGDCAYLGESGCKIYDKRPKVCRTFNCKGFAWLTKERMRAMTGSQKRKLMRELGPPGSPLRIGLDKLARGVE